MSKSTRLLAGLIALALAFALPIAPLSAKKKGKKQGKKRIEKLEQELPGLFKRWLKEDVGYIITSEEKKEFLRLKTSQDREVFIEQFWLRARPHARHL